LALTRKRVQALDPDDPGRGRKAFRIFLEAVLLGEFGNGLINDPGFYQMVENVQDTMERDPAMAAAIQGATRQLLSGDR
ncbi:MAG TPA: hypothetical protein VIT92_08660, partial [Burkholderiaceae bacterium]